MWAFVVVVFYEFPVERESSVFFVVDSEPAFDLALRGGFADAPEDVFDIVSRDSTRRRWIRLCGRSCVFNVYKPMSQTQHFFLISFLPNIHTEMRLKSVGN